jgi:LacI family transcriptional regulator
VVVRRVDVARLAGTSPAVVSYVLNGGPRSVAPDTKARVLAAVEQLGYRPNGIARSLRMNRTMTLGLVIPDTANPFFAELARAVEEAAFGRGYTLLVGNASEDETRQTAYVRTFLERQVDGLFLVPAHGPLTCQTELERFRTPWVILDRHAPGVSGVPEVRVDNRTGAFEATRHLLEHGHRQIACIAGPDDVMSANERVAGWRDALAAAGPEAQAAEPRLRQGAFGRRAGYEAARDLIAAGDVHAIFVASDEQALGVTRAIAEAGWRCPDDVAIASFDGIAAAAYSTPALTTMAQPFTDIAQAGMAALADLIAGNEVAPLSTVLPVTLQARGSCGCADPPGGDLPEPSPAAPTRPAGPAAPAAPAAPVDGDAE